MKRIFRLLAIVFAVLLLVILAMPFLIDANQFRPRLEAELSRTLSREVKVGELKLALLSGGVAASDLSVADDPAFSHAPFLHTQSLTLGVEIWPLVFSRELHVTQLTIEQPQIDLIQSPAGVWNFSSLGGKSEPKPPAAAGSSAPTNLLVKSVKIAKGRITFAQQGVNARARVLEDVSAELDNFSYASEFPFRFSAKLAGGGDIQLNGTAGPVNSADAAQTPAKVQLKLTGFDLAAAGVGGVGGLAGRLAIEGTASSTGKALFVQGRLRAEHLNLAKNGTPAVEPVELDITLEHDLRRGSGKLRRGNIHVGSAPAALTGTYTPQGSSTILNMALSGPEMPVPQLAGMLPAFGIVLPAGSSLQGGTAAAKLTFTGPVQALTIDGTLGLSNTRLSGFDLGSKLSGVERLAGIRTGPNTEIQIFGATLHMAPAGTAIEDINLVVPAIGTLRGAGTVSPNQALDFKMHATLHTGGAAMALIGAHGDAGIPFLVTGTASNPTFRPDVKAFAQEKVQSLEKNALGKSAGGLLDTVLGRKKK